MRLVTIGFVLLCIAGTIWAENSTETEYAAVIMEGKKIGYVIHTRTVEGQTVTTTEEMKMTISRSGSQITVGTVEKAIETTSGDPKGFEVVQNISGMQQQTSGTIANGKISMKVSMMGATQDQTMDWPQGALMVEGLRLLELEKNLTKGQSFTATIFSPSMLSAIDTKVTAGDMADVDLFGRIVKLREMTTTMKTPAGDMTVISYVDEDIKALKTIMPLMGMHFEIISCSKEIAMSENDIVDFLDKMLLTSPKPLNDIASKSTAVYTLKPKANPVHNDDLIIPTTNNQKVRKLENGRVILTVAPAKPAEGQTFPYKGKDSEAINSMKPTQYLQSDRKEILDLARHAIGDTKDATKAIRQIESFVNGYIRNKDLSIGYASASEVAESRQGDCTEHAVLTAAMCRAVGIPARVVFGLIYVDEFGGRKNVFGGHAWTEAFVDDKWIGLDATRAPEGFGPGHITLAIGNGDPKDFFGMVTTLGYFTIENVELK